MKNKLILVKNKIKQIIFWSEKYMKTDMLYVFKSSFWITLGKIIMNASSLAMSVIYANFIPKETYGFFKYIISLGGVISSFSLTGADTALARAVSKGKDGMLKKTFWASLKWGFTITIVSFSAATYYYFKNNNVMTVSLIIIGLLLPIQGGAGLYRAYLNGKKDFKLRTIYDVTQTFVWMLLITITIFFTKKPIYLILIFFTYNTLVFVYLYIRTLQKQKKETLLTDDTTINFAKHLTLIGFIGNISQYIDKVLVFHFLGASQLAIYSFATIPVGKIADMAKTLVKDISFPKLSAKKITDIQKSLLNKMIKLFLISLPITIGYFFISPFLFRLFFPTYLESIKYSQTLGLTLLFIPDALLSQTLLAHAKKEILYITNTTTPLISAIAIIILLPLYGIWGIIISKLVAQIFNFILMFIAYHKTCQTPD